MLKLVFEYLPKLLFFCRMTYFLACSCVVCRRSCARNTNVLPKIQFGTSWFAIQRTLFSWGSTNDFMVIKWFQDSWSVSDCHSNDYNCSILHAGKGMCPIFWEYVYHCFQNFGEKVSWQLFLTWVFKRGYHKCNVIGLMCPIFGEVLIFVLVYRSVKMM